MKLKKILIMTIFVLILTIGAVSASDDNQTSDELAVDDNTEIETLDEHAGDVKDDSVLSMDDEDEKLAVGTEDPSMTVSTEDIMEGEPAVINVSLESDATGSITVQVNNRTFLADIVSGSASLAVSNLGPGTYQFQVTYSGDDNYASVTVPCTVNVMPDTTFEKLKKLIDDDVTGEITLDRDYHGNSSEIVISKTITINGNGHTLNAHGVSRIFHITAGSVVINNLTFVNGFTDSDGGAVYFDLGSTGIVTDCNFTNNSADEDGGAVYVKGLDCKIYNSTFTDNTAGDDGGAILWEGARGLIYNSTFTSNRGVGRNGAHSSGGAINLVGDYTIVEKSKFDGNTADINGGSIYASGNHVNITDSTFTNSNVTHTKENDYAHGGGAIYIEGHDTNIINSTFNQTNARVGGVIYVQGALAAIIDSTITNSYAVTGGAVYINGQHASVINSSFTNTDAKTTNTFVTDNKGGAIYILGNYTTIEGSNFTRASAYQGGILYLQGQYCNVINSSLDHGYSYHDGGAYYSTGTDSNVTGSNFTNNTAGENGGAVYSTGSYCIVSNSNFTDNLAELSGGALYWYGGTNSKYNTVDGCIFTNNTAHGSAADTSITRGGGAIYWSEGGQYDTIKNSYFYYNSVQSTINQKVSGGAVLWDKSYHALVDNCIFVGNFVTTDGDGGGSGPSGVWAQGGAMYLRTNANYTVRNCLFENCSSSKEAGALYIQGLTSGNTPMIFLENSVFINNVAQAKGNSNINGGGAIQVKQCANIEFNNLTFVNNSANKGGGLCVLDSVNNLVVNGATFDGNKASSRGGGIYASDDFTANNITFSNCEATDAGGAVYVAGNSAKSIIQDSTFTNSRAKNGGAVYWGGANGIIINSLFDNNTADENGGAVCWSGDNGRITDSTFSNNTAGENAGAIFWVGYNGNISGSIFLDNAANYYGGAICWGGANGIIINSIFDNNTAGENGGAIFWEGDNGTITDSIFDNNTAGQDGGAIYSSFNVEIRHSHFTDNAATDSGGAIYNCSYEDCTFEANSQPQFYPLRDTPMTITVEVKEDIIVIVTLPSDATGNVTVTGSIIFSTTTAPIINGSCIIPAQVLSSGEYEIRATYDGDESYLANSTAVNITVSKTVPDITVKTGNIEYGEAKSIDVSLPGDATGNVEFTLFKDDSQFIESKNLTVSGGTVSYALLMLNVGRYTLKTRYSGDSRYEIKEANTTFYVSPKINITPDVIIDEEGVITMELGNVTGSIWVYLDGLEDGSKTIKNGRITYYLSTDELTVGNHSIHFQYSGTDFDENVFNYWNETTGSYEPILYPFCIHKKQSESEAETKGDILEVILEDDKGIVLENATGNIEFTILNQFTGEVTKIVVEIVNGIANLDISRFKDGNYIISWYYAGDDKHAPMSDTMVLEINHKVSRITAGDLSTLYTSSQAYSVRVYGSDGKAISGVPVTFLINNKAFKTVKTDKNGVASVAITQKPGTYKITAKSRAVSVTKKLTVKHILSVKKIKIKRTAKKITIKATLKKVNGKYLKRKTIKFRFNGKKYTAKTNKKGVAKIVINKNVLKKLKKGKKVTYQATYLKDTVKKSVKVK